MPPAGGSTNTSTTIPPACACASEESLGTMQRQHPPLLLIPHRSRATSAVLIEHPLQQPPPRAQPRWQTCRQVERARGGHQPSGSGSTYWLPRLAGQRERRERGCLRNVVRPTRILRSRPMAPLAPQEMTAKHPWMHQSRAPRHLPVRHSKSVRSRKAVGTSHLLADALVWAHSLHRKLDLVAPAVDGREERLRRQRSSQG